MGEDRIQSGPPGGAVVALLGTVAVAMATARAFAQIQAHGYRWWSPSGVAQWESAAAHAVSILVPAAIGVLLPWWWAHRRGHATRTLAWTWAILLVGSTWAWRGYLFNRYEVGALWRRPTTLAGQSVPSALTDAGTLLTNAGLTLGALILVPLVAAGLTIALRRLRARRRRGLEIVGWLFAALVLGGASHPERGMRRPALGPDIILVSLDAVRADRLGCYGYARATTPHLDALAAESIRFERAYSQEPWTLTSHMSMLTGLYPDAHGLDFGRSLAASVWTLPERLRDAGYRTWASVYDCFLLNPQFGYAAGFDHYQVNGEAAMARGQRAARWLLESDRPGFVFLHFYDPHSDTGRIPYESGDEFQARLAPDAAESFAGWGGEGGASESLREFNEGQRPLTARQLEHLSQLYDASLAESDAALGAFLARLRDAGRLEDALVVVVSDHGEALGERGHTMHEELMEATLRVPLLMRRPGGERAGTVREELVETVDLAPTILAAAKLGPEALSQGQSLLAPVEREVAFHRSGPAYAISTRDGWRLGYRWEDDAPAVTQLRRYGVGPADGPDALADSSAVVARWIPSILRWHDANRAVAERFGGGAVTMSPEDEALLRSLGYIE